MADDASRLSARLRRLCKFGGGIRCYRWFIARAAAGRAEAVSYTHLTAADETERVDLGGRRIIKNLLTRSMQKITIIKKKLSKFFFNILLTIMSLTWRSAYLPAYRAFGSYCLCSFN